MANPADRIGLNRIATDRIGVEWICSRYGAMVDRDSKMWKNESRLKPCTDSGT